MVKNPIIDKMRLDGGALCLDFVNTIPDRKDGTNRDHLQNFNDLIYWGRKSKAIDNETFLSLEKSGALTGRKAKDLFFKAIELRTLIYSIFLPISKGLKPKPADLKAFNKSMKHYFQFLEVSISKGNFVEQWNFELGDFDSVTARIVKSAHELLLSGKLERVKECPNCGWLFLDSTKNGKRRWCSMQDCGSNVKAREYYHRKKSKE